MMPSRESPEPLPDVESDPGLVHALSDEIGPRPPTSEAERLAADLIVEELRRLGLEPQVEEFASQRSFGPAYLVIFLLALVARPLSRGFPVVGALCGLAAAVLGAGESRFAGRSPLRLLRTGKSQNVWAEIPAAGSARADDVCDRSDDAQTVCLVSHMDSSRSGLMFHPAVVPHLGRLANAAGLAVVVNALGPLLSRFAVGRHLFRAARFMVGLSAGIVIERELRAQDVPGANDNASGVAVCLNLAAYFSEKPLRRTRIVVLVTGSEESGVIGMREFLDTHHTDGWLFMNFDGVSADAPLRVLSRENGPLGPNADPEMLEAAEELGEEQPELRALPLRDGSGLPYDSTAVLARGGRAISIVNQEGAIPDYHWPSDTADRISEEAFTRAVRFGAALVRKLDERS